MDPVRTMHCVIYMDGYKGWTMFEVFLPWPAYGWKWRCNESVLAHMFMEYDE